MILALLVLAVAVDQPFRSTEEMQQWLTYYYLKPRPQLTLASLVVMDRELQKTKGRSLADEVSRGGMRTFYAKLFAQNDSLVSEVEQKLPSLPPSQRTFLREAFRRCSTSACERVLRVSLPPSKAAWQAEPETLDDSWAAFFATGDAKYVREVIKVLPWSELHGDVDRLLAGSAARWSLASNAYQHARVLTICEEVASTSKDPTKRLLEAIVAGAKAERAKNPPPEPK